MKMYKAHYVALRRFAFTMTALLVVALARADGSDARELDRLFARSTLQIATPDARLHKFSIWVADNDARRARGLMFIRELGDDEGMLFIYPEVQPVSMWMKNTYVPLDMLFVRADGRIERVAENTTPQSLETIASGKPVKAVVELKAGSATRFKIRPGARVLHAAFSTTQ
jgi:uncharacterized protein